jgi:hypothetical protein
MKSILVVIAISVWAFLCRRYWRTTNAIDRYEGMILRPLSASMDLLGLYYALNKSWWAAAIAFFWGLFVIGGIGQGLRADRSDRELANPPDFRTGHEMEELSPADAVRLGKAVMKMAWFSSVPAFLLFFLHGLKWYVAAIASLGTALLFGPVLLVIPLGSAVLALRKREVIN